MLLLMFAGVMFGLVAPGKASDRGMAIFGTGPCANADPAVSARNPATHNKRVFIANSWLIASRACGILRQPEISTCRHLSDTQRPDGHPGVPRRGHGEPPRDL